RRDPLLGASRRPATQTVLPQPPDEQVYAILTEERLVPEDHRGNAPVPGGLERSLVLRDDDIMASRVRGDRRIQLVQVETGPRRRVGEMRAFVPAFDVAAPDDARDLGHERESTPTLGRSDPQARQSVDVGLLCRDLPGRGILYDRVGSRPPVRNALV